VDALQHKSEPFLRCTFMTSLRQFSSYCIIVASFDIDCTVQRTNPSNVNWHNQGMNCPRTVLESEPRSLEVRRGPLSLDLSRCSMHCVHSNCQYVEWGCAYNRWLASVTSRWNMPLKSTELRCRELAMISNDLAFS
jgi:hypothetical protein